MKNIQDKIIESNDKLPKLRRLKKLPDWVMSYPDFCDKMEEIWDNDKKLLATIMYFITKNEDVEGYGWSSMKVDIKDLYHQI